jgi:hypothetical protein
MASALGLLGSIKKTPLYLLTYAVQLGDCGT